VLRHAPERVWRALREPEEESAWHPTPARFEPRVGGRVEYAPGGHVAGMPGTSASMMALAEFLKGPSAPPEHGPDSPGQWPVLNSRYQDKFGISPEEATPPPRRD
jgi:hypothetical protein